VVARIVSGYRTACHRRSFGGPWDVASNEDPLILVADEDDGLERRWSTASTVAAREDAREELRRIALQPLPTDDGCYPGGTAAGTAGGGGKVSGTKAPSRRASSSRRRSRVGTSGISSSSAGGGGGGHRDRGMVVVVLDELDGLLGGRHGDELIGELFALAAAPGSRLVLLGIANSIDLVQQLLRPGGAFHVRKKDIHIVLRRMCSHKTWYLLCTPQQRTMNAAPAELLRHTYFILCFVPKP